MHLIHKKQRNFLKCFTNSFACIYLIKLGTVREIRKLFENITLPDLVKEDDVIYKYGYTAKGLFQRIVCHIKDSTYGNPNLNPIVEMISLVYDDKESTYESEIKKIWKK